MAKKAIIVGASGLIGSKLLNLLLDSQEYDEILSVSRKSGGIINPKLKELVIDFAQLEKHALAIKGDVLFCCLGTTSAQTPDLKEYYIIDHDYPVELAKIALKNDIEQYHLISSIGANANSSIFYTRTKGEAEADIVKLGLNCLHIYQPSQLAGTRKKPRTKERMALLLMKLIGPLLFGRLKKYRAIPALTVARAMYNQSLKNETGVFIHPSDKIKNL